MAQSLTSVSADDYLLLMEGELRFSQSIVEKAESKDGERQLQIQTQISFFTWQRTARGDPLYNGNARVSSRQSIFGQSRSRRFKIQGIHASIGCRKGIIVVWHSYKMAIIRGEGGSGGGKINVDSICNKRLYGFQVVPFL